MRASGFCFSGDPRLSTGACESRVEEEEEEEEEEKEEVLVNALRNSSGGGESRPGVGDGRDGGGERRAGMDGANGSPRGGLRMLLIG